MEKENWGQWLLEIKLSLSAFREEMFSFGRKILYVLIGIFFVLIYIAFH